jgi:hypothetical protein
MRICDLRFGICDLRGASVPEALGRFKCSLTVQRTSEVGRIVLGNNFEGEPTGRFAALDPRTPKGWPVYGSAQTVRRANPEGVACLDEKWVRSPLQGLVCLGKGVGAINRLPLNGVSTFGPSCAWGCSFPRGIIGRSPARFCSRRALLWPGRPHPGARGPTRPTGTNFQLSTCRHHVDF